jgi:transcriptional regulator with XRE-family HTH domain
MTKTLSDEAQRLTYFIKLIGLKAVQLSHDYGVSKSLMSHYMNGNAGVPIELIKYLHNKYKLSFNWFFSGVGNPVIKEAEKRTTMHVLTDIMVSVEALAAQQEAIDNKVNRLIRDFYSKGDN